MALLTDLTGHTVKVPVPELASKAGPGGVDPYQPGRGVMYGTTYTPEIMPGENTTSQKLTPYKVLFQRNGPNVLCTGTVKVGTTKAANSVTSFFMSLPVESDLGYALDLAGSGARLGSASLLSSAIIAPVQIRGDATGNRAEFIFNSNTATAQDITFVFQYGII